MSPTAVRHEALLTQIHTDIDEIDRDRWDALGRFALRGSRCGGGSRR